MKKKEVLGIMEMIKQNEANEVLNEIHRKMRDFGYKGRITRKMIEDGIKEAGCTFGQLLLQKRDDMGCSLMSMMFLDDQFPPILEILNKMDMLKELDPVLYDFASDLIHNLMHHLR